MTAGETDAERSTLDHPMNVATGDRVEDQAALAAMRSKVFGTLFARPALRRFGRYIVLDMLGEGGMGVVLKGYDDELDRQVALKVLHADPSGQQGARLKREAQALARLAHPNVVQVFEIGETEGQVFVAMELVKGQTLRQWHGEPGTSRHWVECVEAYLQAGRGLAAAHAKGLVHRDFKPGNAIMDDEGRVRVLDFGLARRGDGDDESYEATGGVPSVIRRARTDKQEVVPLDLSLTKTGAVLGTPAYMPPEQMTGKETDARSDQFSFCVSLYEAVYGERPFEGLTLLALVTSMARGRVRPAPEGREVPAELRAVLLRGLATEPEDRWPSMDQLLERLQRMVDTLDEEEITHLRRHIDLRIGVRARVDISLFVGVFQIVSGVAVHSIEETTGLKAGYPFLFTVCGFSSLFVIAFTLHAIRRRVAGSRRTPMSLMSRTQMSLVVTSAVAVIAVCGFGLALGLRIEATVPLVLLTFGLLVGTMAVFLPRMLIPACVFMVSATSLVIWSDALWLWWAASAGGGIVMMGWAWHGLRRETRPAVGESP